MTNLTSVQQVKQLLDRFRLRPTKRLGQNFLIDRNTLDRIASESGAGPGANVMEIGPGLGVVTQALAATGARVVCVEADHGLRPVLGETLGGLANVEVVMSDFLKLDLPAFLAERWDGKWIVLGNLPYYITTPIILRLVEIRSMISSALVMVQREVAQRLMAQPGSSDYGSIGVLVSYYFEIDSVMRVSRNVFYPVPDVDSEFIRLTPRAVPPVAVRDEEALFRVVRSAFGKRRKTLVNALSSSAELGWDKDRAQRALEMVGIDPVRRGETLSLREFAAIADAGGRDES
jgi:16S rRNA (adenine1518-N6/adenine1519-N6)-dimethyltransferase